MTPGLFQPRSGGIPVATGASRWLVVSAAVEPLKRRQIDVFRASGARSFRPFVPPARAGGYKTIAACAARHIEPRSGGIPVATGASPWTGGDNECERRKARQILTV